MNTFAKCIAGSVSLILSLVPYPSLARAGIDYRGTWVHGPITSDDVTLIHKYPEEAHVVYVLMGADDHVFDDATLFVNLKHASLLVPNYNSGNLQALAHNYPSLQSLTIEQPTALSAADAQALRTFTELKLLQLDCPVEDPRALLTGLGTKLEKIEFEKNNLTDCGCSLPKSPQLQDLTVIGGTVGPDFLQQLDAPKLTRVSFHSANVAPGALPKLAKFKHLHSLTIADSIVDDTDLKYLQTLPGVRILDCSNKVNGAARQ